MYTVEPASGGLHYGSCAKSERPSGWFRGGLEYAHGGVAHLQLVLRCLAVVHEEAHVVKGDRVCISKRDEVRIIPLSIIGNQISEGHCGKLWIIAESMSEKVHVFST